MQLKGQNCDKYHGEPEMPVGQAPVPSLYNACARLKFHGIISDLVNLREAADLSQPAQVVWSTSPHQSNLKTTSQALAAKHRRSTNVGKGFSPTDHGRPARASLS